MDIVKCIAVIAAAVPLVCSAASQNNAEQVTCSGTQTTDTTNGLQIDCVGSLTIVGGSLTSDTFIKLTASDALYLDNITVKAPSVNLDGATISVGSAAKIDSANSYVSAGISLMIGNQLAGGAAWGGNSLNNYSSGSVLTNGSISIGAGGIRGKEAITLTGNNSIPTTPWTITTIVEGKSCTQSGAISVFKTVESGTRFCAGSKKAFHRVQFLRATAECRVAPGSFDIAATQDFPWDTTQTKVAECNDIGGGNSSCALYDTSNSSNTAQLYAGRLALKWGRDGDIHGLSGRIIEKTADGCHSESTLKLVKRMP